MEIKLSLNEYLNDRDVRNKLMSTFAKCHQKFTLDEKNYLIDTAMYNAFQKYNGSVAFCTFAYRALQFELINISRGKKQPTQPRKNRLAKSSAVDSVDMRDLINSAPTDMAKFLQFLYDGHKKSEVMRELSYTDLQYAKMKRKCQKYLKKNLGV